MVEKAPPKESAVERLKRMMNTQTNEERKKEREDISKQVDE